VGRHEEPGLYAIEGYAAGLVEDGAARVLWFRTTWAHPELMGAGGPPVEATLERIRFDCAGRRRVEAAVDLSGGRPVVARLEPGAWEGLSPTTYYGTVAGAACRP
jgi:hypothetical protein